MSYELLNFVLNMQDHANLSEKNYNYKFETPKYKLRLIRTCLQFTSKNLKTLYYCVFFR